MLEFYDSLFEKFDSPELRVKAIKEAPIEVSKLTSAVRARLKRELLAGDGWVCPIYQTRATDLHEVVLPRNDMPPTKMLAIGGYCKHNCIVVSREANAEGETPGVRGALIKVMEHRGYDPIGWLEGLIERGWIKAGQHIPKIERD